MAAAQDLEDQHMDVSDFITTVSNVSEQLNTYMQGIYKGPETVPDLANGFLDGLKQIEKIRKYKLKLQPLNVVFTKYEEPGMIFGGRQ
jgi:hypothetical protein